MLPGWAFLTSLKRYRALCHGHRRPLGGIAAILELEPASVQALKTISRAVIGKSHRQAMTGRGTLGSDPDRVAVLRSQFHSPLGET